MRLGSLVIENIFDRQDLLADPVLRGIRRASESEVIGIAEIDPSLSDTARFCDHYQVSLEQSANCIILKAKRSQREWYAVCMVLGADRADINGVVRRSLDARRVSFASMEEAVSQTGMEFGAITPIGVPEGWPILVDKKIIESDTVVIGSGRRKSKIVIPGSFLATLPGAIVVEGLAQEKK